MGSMTMADLQLQAGDICNGGRWWSDARIERPHDYPPLAMSAPFSCSSADLSSGRASAGGGRFDWSACPGSTVDVMVAEPVGASDESPGSNSTMTYQDIEYPGGAYGSMAVAQTMDAYGLQCMLDYELSSPTFNWSRPFLSADETSVHGLIQEVMYSSRPYCQQESDQIHKIRSTLDLLEDRHAMYSSTDWDSALFPASSVLPERSWHEQVDESLQPPPVEPHRKPKQQVQLTDEAPFWNPSVSIATGACSTRMHHSEPIHEEVKENKIKAKYSGAKKCSSSSLDENDGSEPVLKKPRIETPSPLPTFKVRKEKLGDRITALQQLVSPFGKTDTASVLHEAIDYIKFLHDQVQVLSSPHSNVKDQTPRAIESAGTNQDLRSRGLCLVPISSTVQIVARENPVDFWSLGFGAAHS